MNWQPASLADFLPEKKTDDFGYVWIKERRNHTLEFVGYCDDVEIGSIVLAHENCQFGEARVKECQYAWEQAKIKHPDGICLNDVMEEIRSRWDVYGNS